MKRLHHIDALRGIAAIAIAWFHLFTQNEELQNGAIVIEPIAIITVWGRFGVQLFFALSGFVLGYTLLERRRIKTLSDLGHYLFRRSLRLDLTYWAVLIGYLIFLPLAIHLAEGRYGTGEYISNFRDLVGNIFYFLPFIGGTKMIPVVWTLVLEVQFYAFFALIMYLSEKLYKMGIGKLQSIRLFILVCITLFSGLYPLGILKYIDNWLFPHLYIFMLGMSAYMIVFRIFGWRIISSISVGTTLIGFILHRDSYVAASLISFLVFLGICLLPAANKFFSKSLFQILGKLSYSIYLLHPLVGTLVIELLKRYVSDSPPFILGYVLLGVIMTVAVSAIVWKFIEKPSINLSKRVHLAS